MEREIMSPPRSVSKKRPSLSGCHRSALSGTHSRPLMAILGSYVPSHQSHEASYGLDGGDHPAFAGGLPLIALDRRSGSTTSSSHALRDRFRDPRFVYTW